MLAMGLTFAIGLGAGVALGRYRAEVLRWLRAGGPLWLSVSEAEAAQIREILARHTPEARAAQAAREAADQAAQAAAWEARQRRLRSDPPQWITYPTLPPAGPVVL